MEMLLLLGTTSAEARPMRYLDSHRAIVERDRDTAVDYGASRTLPTNRYQLGDNDLSFNEEPASEGMSVRWRLNRIKMRVPFSTSGLQ